MLQRCNTHRESGNGAIGKKIPVKEFTVTIEGNVVCHIPSVNILDSQIEIMIGHLNTGSIGRDEWKNTIAIE